MNFGERLKALRVERHVSQEDLADYLNVSRQTISRWESSITSPDLNMLEKICEYFEVSYEELLNHPKDKKSHYPFYILVLFIIIFSISFFLPHSQQDFTNSAIIITPAGFTLFTGIIGILLSIFLIIKNHRK